MVEARMDNLARVWRSLVVQDQGEEGHSKDGTELGERHKGWKGVYKYINQKRKAKEDL